jgi:hypothetical protein
VYVHPDAASEVIGGAKRKHLTPAVDEVIVILEHIRCCKVNALSDELSKPAIPLLHSS